MIICHCTGISDHDIDRAITWMRAADPLVLITPGKVYRALGARADCGDCVKLFVATMRKHPDHPVPKPQVADVPEILRNLRSFNSN